MIPTDEVIFFRGEGQPPCAPKDELLALSRVGAAEETSSEGCFGGWGLTCWPQPGRCSTLTSVMMMMMIIIFFIIFMRDQHSPLPMDNMLIGVIKPIISPWGIKIRHPNEQYVDWGNSIKYIFIRDHNSPPTMSNMLIGVITPPYFHKGSQISPPPYNNMLIGVITSTLSS